MKVTAKELTKHYGDFCAVNNVSFSFESGKIFSIIGQNGSGKTSVIRMMLDTLSKTSGNVSVDGNEIRNYKNRIGYLPEERGLYIKDTVESQLYYFARLKNMKGHEIKKSVDYWLKYMGLEEKRKNKVETLSKGNQQKVQLLASLIHNPDILIFDEPFSGLDPVNSEMFIELLHKLKDENKCVMVSSHQLSYIEKVCDKLLIISNSNPIYYGNVKELKAQYVNEYICIKTRSEFSGLNQFKVEKVDEDEYRIYYNQTAQQVEIFEQLIEEKINIESFYTGSISLHDIFIEKVGMMKSEIN